MNTNKTTDEMVREVETLIDDLGDELNELKSKPMSTARWAETALVFASIVEAWGWLAELQPTRQNRQTAAEVTCMMKSMCVGRA